MSLTNFLEAFFPDEREPLFIFGYSPKEMSERQKRGAQKIKTSRLELKTDAALQQRLKNINREQGLYFTVNSGGTLKAEINRINAVFCEIDDLPLEVQHDQFDNCAFPPSIRVETKKSVHAYWLLDEQITVEEFIEIQLGLIDKFRSDKAIKNQNRVMRLPFFNHLSFANNAFQVKTVTLHTFDIPRRFNAAELREAFPFSEPVQAVPKYEPGQANTDWEKLFEDVRQRFTQLPGYHTEHGGRLAAARGVCHNGETNRTLVMNLQTGKVFCRNECDYDTILRALNLSRPIKTFKAEYNPRKQQSSPLYKWYKAYQEQR